MDTVRVPTSFNQPVNADPRSYIPLCVPQLQGNEWKYLKECLDTGWVSSAGSFVERFERQVAAYVGSKHAVAVVNGTSALHVALRVIGLQPDEEVLVPDLTFVAPVNAIRYCQAHPVLIDADLRTWQMDVGRVARFLTRECEMKGDMCYNKRTGRRVRAILPVHLLGLSCEIDSIIELAGKHGLKVVEDAAEAMGVRFRGCHVGIFGDVGALSFNGNKIITAGGGGMLITNSAAYADYARYLTTQAKDDELEHIHNEIGYNYRLSNIQAAVGVAQVEQIENFIIKKHTIARTYEEAFSDLDDVVPMPTPPHTRPTYWLYTVLLPEKTSLEGRQEVIKRLNEQGIGARPFWHTIHNLPAYRTCQAFEIEHSGHLYRRGVSLPSSVGLSAVDLQRCIVAVKQILR
jgi:perosamine synthetase